MEGMHGVRYGGKVQSFHTSPGNHPLMCSATWKLSKHYTYEILMEAALHRHEWSLLQCPVFSPPWRAKDGLESSMVWSVWWPTPILKLYRSSPRVSSLEQKTLLSLRNSKASINSGPGAGGRDQHTYFFYYFTQPNWRECEGGSVNLSTLEINGEFKTKVKKNKTMHSHCALLWKTIFHVAGVKNSENYM